ncbi:MAG: hypothetical protein QOE34_1910 [Verrucomicrobiota bacterium]|jgi:hypothetical protein
MNVMTSFLKAATSGWHFKFAVAGLLMTGFSLTAMSQAIPTPTPVVTSSQVPPDVSIPSTFTGNAIAFFDDYSWRTFVALVWPGLQGQRGMPDPKQTVGGTGPRVFETFKALPEVFHNDGSPPSGWNDFDPAQYNPCGTTAAWGDMTLASFSKFSDLGQAGFGNLVGPLVAQGSTPTYVHYLTLYNQIEFEQIVSTNWYLRAKLPATLTFKVNSLDLKSAWMDMTFARHPERYYTRMASVMDPATGECSQKTVGLVGLHIVQKTATRPQWIWSTFEQVDNVPPAQPGAPGTFGFNDGSGKPQPSPNPYPLSPLPIPVPPPFNVTRALPIHSSTQSTNAAYQKALKSQGSGVWQFYQLVMTQWPLQLNPPNPIPPNQSGGPANTFPGTGATTTFSNTTLETFDQGKPKTGQGGTGCMACHTITQTATDFLWSLKDHAFPPKIPGLMMQDVEMRNLRTMMQTTRQAQIPSEKTKPNPKVKPTPRP